MFGASVRKLCIWVIIMISMKLQQLAQQEEQGDHNTITLAGPKNINSKSAATSVPV